MLWYIIEYNKNLTDRRYPYNFPKHKPEIDLPRREKKMNEQNVKKKTKKNHSHHRIIKINLFLRKNQIYCF